MFVTKTTSIGIIFTKNFNKRSKGETKKYTIHKECIEITRIDKFNTKFF